MFEPLHKIHRVVLGTLALTLVLIVAAAVERDDREVRLDAMAKDREGLVFKSRRSLMGTEFKVTIWAPKERAEVAAQALGDVFDELASLEKLISSWQPESETSRVNSMAGKEAVPVGPELQQLLGLSLHWARETGGAFDVSGGPLFELWEQAREREILPSQDEIDACRVSDESSDSMKAVFRTCVENMMRLLAPFAPHIAEEIWHELGHEESILRASWPGIDSEALTRETVELVVQVNGKVRGRLVAAVDMDRGDLEAAALATESIQKYLDGKTVRKVIIVPNRLVNIAVS